jgi:environmental stress-induced protein Ves
MTVTHLPKNEFSPAQWSGGSTTELYIYPETADYKLGDYHFRLSTATVEVETSDFTPLLGVSRTLMVLNGNMKLTHEGHHASQLGKFDVDKFSGGWNTASQGKCVDFNLMTKGKTKGDQMGAAVSANQKIDFPIQASWDWLFLYLYTGDINVMINNNIKNLYQGDLLIIHKPTESSIQIEGVEKSEFVLCNISE